MIFGVMLHLALRRVLTLEIVVMIRLRPPLGSTESHLFVCVCDVNIL